MQHSNLVIVQTYGTRTVADLAQGTLEAAGIQAMVQADAAGGLRDHLAWAGADLKFSYAKKMQPRRTKSSAPRLRAA